MYDPDLFSPAAFGSWIITRSGAGAMEGARRIVQSGDRRKLRASSGKSRGSIATWRDLPSMAT